MGAQHYWYSRLGTTRGDPSLVHVECTFSSGSPTVDTAQSDPGITITRDAAGDYDVAGLPTGQLLHPVNFTLDLAADAPVDTTVGYAQPRSVSASTGTCKILTFARGNGDQDDPPDGARLSATFLASEAAAGRGLVSPAQVEGLRAWVADDVSGAGSASFRVLDLSGNGNHAAQPSASAQPTAGGGVLTFDVTAQQHVLIPLAGLALQGARQVAIIQRVRSDVDVPLTTQRLVRVNNLFTTAILNSGEFVFDIVTQGGGTNRTSLTAGSVDWTLEHVVSALYDRGAVTLRVDGIPLATGSAIPTLRADVTDPLTIGAASASWDGSTRHIFVLAGRIPSEAELRFLEGFQE